MNKKRYLINKVLLGENAEDHGINQAWKQDNQAWWDWYVSLAYDEAEYSEDSCIELPALQKFNMISESDIQAELSLPYEITDKQITSFQKEGFIKLRNVLSPIAVSKLRQELLMLLNKEFNNTKKKKNRFLSLEMMWLKNTLIRKYVLSSRIAKICADLLGVKKVRLYHDNALAKEPGCGRTPWHYDDHHFPLATNDVVTAWIPAQPTPIEMGPLVFAKPLSVYELVKEINFNKFDTSYDKQISDIFKAEGVLLEEKAFEAGEVSFHHNLCFHSASKNRTTRTRVVLANTFFADGARVVEKPTMVSGDWQKFIPNTKPGEIAASELNPICWPINKKVNYK